VATVVVVSISAVLVPQVDRRGDDVRLSNCEPGDREGLVGTVVMTR